MEKRCPHSKISKLLIDKISIIIKMWEDRVRACIQNSQFETSGILIDHLPDLMIQIAETLDHDNPEHYLEDNKYSAREHAKFRAFNTNFSLVELVKEYSLLRDIIFEILFQEQIPELYQIQILHKFIDEAIQSAVKEFSTLKDESLNRAYKDAETSHQHLREFFMQAPLALAILKGPNHLYELANNHYENLVRRKVVGKPFMEAFPEKVVYYFKELLDKVYKEGKSFIRKEAPVQIFASSAEDKQTWVNYYLHPFKNPDNTVAGVIVAIIDVTELVNSRKTLEKSEARLANERFKLHSIFDKLPAAMSFWKGRDLIFEKINPRYQEIFGSHQLLGRRLIDAVPDSIDQNFVDQLLRVLETGESYSVHDSRTMVRQEDGSLKEYYFDFTCVQILDAEGNPYGVFGHTLDVTERVKANRIIEENKVKLENYVNLLVSERELRERFVAALSHDLRTPLSAAKMSAQVLLRKSDDSSTVEKMCHRIAENMNRADNMIRDILDASRIKAGEKISLNRIDCELNSIVEKTLENLATIHGERFDLIQGATIHGHWDCHALQRIVENLVNNAVKYGLGTTPITIRIEQKEDLAFLSVHNLGNPLSEEEQNYIFQPFKRVESSVQGQKGWGIGLTLVSGFAEAHGGYVSVKSSKNEGTTFTVCLPVKAS